MFAMVNQPFTIPALPTQLTRAKFEVYHSKPQKTGHTAKLVYYSLTMVILTFTLVKYGQWGL